MPGNGVLTINIRDSAVLYASYMPFLKSGGLFVPTNKAFAMGAEVFLLITLPGESEKFPVAGKIVWLTPARAQGIRVRGVGIQFNDPEGVAKAKVENALVGLLDSEKATNTL